MMIHDEPPPAPVAAKACAELPHPTSPQQSPRPPPGTRRTTIMARDLASENENVRPIGTASFVHAVVSRGYNGAAPALPARQ